MFKYKNIIKILLPINILAMSGSGLFFLAIIRSRFIDHKSEMSFLQMVWDSLAGTYGMMFNILTFLCGAGIFAGFWLFLVCTIMVRYARPSFYQVTQHVTNNLKPLALLGILGILIFFAGPAFLNICILASALFIVWALVRIVVHEGDLQVNLITDSGTKNTFWKYILAIPLILVPIFSVMGVIYFSSHNENRGNGILPHTAYVISFDTEIDWIPQEDGVRMGRSQKLYLDTFKYIATGVLEELASGLAERKVPATFYCTANVAKNHPEMLQKLEKLGHEVGVHLHMRNYPALFVRGDELSSYAPRDQLIAIKQAKADIEKAVGHVVYSFRSGQWSCDPGVEDACFETSFSSISNHGTTYLLPSGVWQVATMYDYDVLRDPRMLWRSLKDNTGNKLIPLFSHPMLLWDHAANQPREKMLQEFFIQLDEFKLKYPDISFLTTTEAVSILKYEVPHNNLGILMGAISLVLIFLCSIFSFKGSGLL